MRVGFVVYGDLSPRSGGYLYDRTLVEHLRAAGDDVEVFSLPERSYARTLAVNFSRSLCRRLRRADLDVLLQDELCHPSLAWLNDRLDLDVPVVALVHHLRSDEGWSDWRERLYRRVERRYLRSVDAYVCTSDATRRSIAALTDPEPSVVARPGGDRFGRTVTADRVRERALAGPLRILFVGNVTRRKGLHTLAEGLERVECDWRLTVVGDLEADPEYVSSVRRRVESLGVDDRVTFVGRLPDDRLTDVLAESHLTAIPSRVEGYGIAYLEGMAFGLPAVATSAGGAREFVRHRENGLLVEPEDPSAVTDAVSPLCRNRVRLSEMGVRALETYREHPTWAQSAETVRSFLRERTGENRCDGGRGDGSGGDGGRVGPNEPSSRSDNADRR